MLGVGLGIQSYGQSWTQTDIGDVGVSGSGVIDGGTMTILGAGLGVGSGSDSFNYVYTSGSGNIELITRVLSQSSTSNYSMGGVMIRSGLNPTDEFAAINVTPGNGVNFSYRAATGQASGQQLGLNITAPVWLRLVLSGSTFAGYWSADGEDWKLVGNVAFGDAANVGNNWPIYGTSYMGFFVDSSASGTLNSVTFDHVSMLTNVPQRSDKLVLWLRGDAGVIASGSQVTQWQDQSGYANHAVQITGGNQPLLSIEGLNQLNVVSFSGSGQYLQLGTLNLDLADQYTSNSIPGITNGMTVVVVARPSTTGSNARFIDFGNGAGSNNIIFGRSGTTQDLVMSTYNGTSGSSVMAPGSIVQNQYQIFETTYDVSAQNGMAITSLYVDGQLINWNTLYGINQIVRTSNYIGKSNWLGDASYGGDIAEILIYNQTLSDAMRQQVEAYLEAKYAITPAINLAVPTSSLLAGTYVNGQTMTLNGPVGASIYYTTDGSTPTAASTLYTGPITVNATTTIRYIALEPGFIGSAIGSVSIVIDPSSSVVNRNGLLTWLKADQGIVTQRDNYILSEWLDQSGSGNNAQAVGRAYYNSSAVNGLPAINFDNSAYLQFGSGFADFTQGMTILMVVQPADTRTQTLVNFGNGASSDNLVFSQSGSQGTSLVLYDSSTATQVTGSTGLTLYQYQVLEAVYTGGTAGISMASLYQDGALVGSGSVGIVNNITRTGNYIAHSDWINTYFNGQIAELLIYNRALGMTERQQIESYLMSKYGLTSLTQLATPSSNVATGTYVSGQTVTLNGPSGAAIYYTTDGSTPTSASTLYSGPITVNTTTTLSWIAVEANFADSRMGVAVITIDPSSSSVVRNGLITWLKGDAGVVTSGSFVTQWLDQSGNGNHASQSTQGQQPVLFNVAFNGLPTVGFDNGQYMQFGSGFADFTQGMTILMVAQPTSTSSNVPFVDFGNTTSSGDEVTLYQGALNQGYQGINLSIRENGRSSVSGTNGLLQNRYQVLESVYAGGTVGASSSSLYQNGNLIVSGSVGILNNITRTANYLGRSQWFNDPNYHGQISEILIYNRALSSMERQQVEAYLATKYQISSAAILATPISSVSTGIYTGGQTVTLSGPSGASIYYTTDGSAPTSGSTLYSGAITVNSSTTLKWIAVQSGYTNSLIGQAMITIDPTSSSVIRNGLVTWLKADTGIITTGSLVAQWLDQSGNSNDAIQGLTAYQPVFSGSAINGGPVVNFNGANQYLSFRPGYADFTQGMTLLIVTQPAATGNSSKFIDFGNGAPSDNVIFGQNNTGQGILFQSYNGTAGLAISSTSGLSPYQYQVVEAVTGSTGSANLYQNGSLVSSGTVTALNNVVRNSNFLAKGSWVSDPYYAGQIAEILIYNRALNTTERQQLESYLASKYQIPSAAVLTTPISNVPTGTYTSGQTVTLSGPAGSAIYYTTDGSMPSASSTPYTGPITINTTTTLRWIATQSGYADSIAGNTVITIDSASSSVARNGLSAWLRSDVGVVTSGSQVLQWTDQSGNLNNAQGFIGVQPTLSTLSINGFPTLNFDGDSQYLQFGPGFADFTQGLTILVVAKPSVTAGNNQLINFGNGLYADNVVFSQGSLSLYNGSTASAVTNVNNSGANQYEVFETVYSGGAAGVSNASLYQNGTEIFNNGVESLNNITRTLNYIARGQVQGISTTYGGQIAEILIYNRALSTTERQQAESYLLGKYNLLATPSSNVPTGTYVSGQTVTLSGPSGASIYYTTDGSTPTSASTLYSGPITVNSTTTLQWIAVESGYTSSLVGSATLTIDASSSTVIRSGLLSWLKADTGVMTNSGGLTIWRDQSGNVNDATGKINGVISSAINGLPAVDLESNPIQLVSGFADFTQGMTVLIVTQPTSSGAGIPFMDFGNGSPSDNVIFAQDNTGRGIALTLYNGNSSSQITSNVGLTQNQYQLQEAVYVGGTTSTSSAALYQNGVLVVSGSMGALNNVTRNDNYIGQSSLGAANFTGQIAEILIYNRALNSTERQQLEGYLMTKYNLQITLITPTSNVPTGTYASGQTVTLSGPAGAAIYYTTDGSVPTSSSSLYSGPITVNSSTTLQWVAIQSGYANSSVGQSVITIDSASSPVVRSGLIAWLRSDVGVENDNGSVAQWTDQSGHENDANSDWIAPPTLVNSTVNGFPAVNFDGSSQGLQFGSGFSDFTQGMTVLVVASPATTSGNEPFIDFGNGSPSDNVVFGQDGTGQSSSVTLYNGAVASSVSGTSGWLPNHYQVFGMVYAGGTTGTSTANLYQGGALISSGSTATLNNIIRNTNYIAASSMGYANYGGYIAEILIYNRALNDTERQQVEGYLMQKYALAVPQLAQPLFSVPGGALLAPQQIALAVPSGEIIYYTLDGTTPTSGSLVYTGPINVAWSQTIKAIAYQNGHPTSAVETVSYTLDPDLWPAPTYNAGDHTPPTINLQLPGNAILEP